MEEVSPDEEVADELTCAICLLFYDEPRALACHHTFCTACLRALLAGAAKKGHTATCPLCRVPIQTSDVTRLPIADELQRQVLALQRQVPPPEASAPPAEVAADRGFVGESFTKRTQPGFFDKLFASRHVAKLSAEDRANGLCYGASFSVSEDEVLALVRDWLGGLWLLPAGLNPQELRLGPITPVFLPFYSFDVHTRSTCEGRAEVVKNTNKPNKPVVTRVVYLPGGYLESEYHHLVLATVDPDRTLKELTEEIHIDGAQFSVLTRLCDEASVRSASDVFHGGVEASVLRADESKALNAIRSRCGLGAAVVRAEVTSIQTATDWQETLVCVPFYRTSFVYEGRTFEVLVHGVSGACAGTRPYGTGALGTLGKKVVLGLRALGEWMGIVDPVPANEGGNNNNNNDNNNNNNNNGW